MMTRLAHARLLDRMQHYVARNLKNRSHTILRLWTDHCEYIIAQKCRRGQQMVSLYTKIWDDRALRELFHRFRRQVQRHAKGFVLSSVGLCAFDWDKERIPYDTLKQHYDEIDFVWRLQNETIVCSSCKLRRVIDHKVEGIEYCWCSKEKLKQGNNASLNEAASPVMKCFSEWVPYLERKNMVVWRREEKPGLYAYKVHASYPDVTAEDFLHVQTDVQYRKIWDRTAVALEVIDTDPLHNSRSHVVYWEMLWPKLFANRDYVYNRRYVIDRARKLIIIANKSIEHPSCPIRPNNQRVRDYWSYMVIKPTTTFKKPGLEYVLTYFDNPGVIVPPAITSWVAQKQMPDFLNKLYQATVEYAKTRVHEEEELSFWDIVKDPGFEYPPDPELACSSSVDDDDKYDVPNDRNLRSDNQDDSDLMDDVETAPRKTSWWSYLTPYHYFYH